MNLLNQHFTVRNDTIKVDTPLLFLTGKRYDNPSQVLPSEITPCRPPIFSTELGGCLESLMRTPPKLNVYLYIFRRDPLKKYLPEDYRVLSADEVEIPKARDLLIGTEPPIEIDCTPFEPLKLLGLTYRDPQLVQTFEFCSLPVLNQIAWLSRTKDPKLNAALLLSLLTYSDVGIQSKFLFDDSTTNFLLFERHQVVAWFHGPDKDKDCLLLIQPKWIEKCDEGKPLTANWIYRKVGDRVVLLSEIEERRVKLYRPHGRRVVDLTEVKVEKGDERTLHIPDHVDLGLTIPDQI